MIFGSLFAGIGGIDLGLERAGMACAWQVERDPYCRRVLAKHWPTVPRFEDVHRVGSHNLAPVDLICGGFPCQPVSVAGNQKAQNDERWLWPEFARIIREMGPRFALMENVPGLLVRGHGDVLGDLAEIGYDAEWDCLPASAFGAPHLRDRVFILAYAIGVRRNEDGIFPGKFDPAWRETQLGQFGGMARPESWGETHADNLRNDDGIPGWLDRAKALGNAVVPQVAEWIGRRIMGACADA